MAAAVILVEAEPAIVATGGTVTVRLAGGGGARPYDYSGQSDWRAGIAALPTMIASLEYDGGEFPQGSVPSAVAIDWQGSSKALLATLASYLWTDAAITVRHGPEGTLPPVLISGKVLDATAESGGLKIALADPAASLKKPLLTARFAGTGGLEGPVEWDGLIRKRVWGRVWNLAGEPIDKANNIYAFADPLRPIQAFDAVRDKGAAAAALNTLAWQGSAAATFTALQAAVAPAGGGVICPSIACVKWWTQPAGDLCADLRGEVGAGYVETTASIAQRLVEAIGGPAFTAGTIAGANAARTAPVGWIAQDDSTTVAAMLDELLGNSSLLWLLEDAGTITLRTWSWGAAVASARSESVDRAKVLRPLGTRRLGYKRNETQMARGDLAAIVLAGDVNYADGTPIEALKPAQSGADKTSTNTAAAIAGQAWAATNGSEALTSNLRVPFAAGQNRVRFSLFEKGNTGWVNRFNPAGLPVAQTAFFNNGLRIGMLEWTFTAANQTVSIGTASGQRYRIPVTPGEFVYVSIGLRGLGPISSVFPSVIWTSSADTYVSGWNLPTNTGELLGGILTRWEGLVQVPAGAYFAYLEVYFGSSGAGAASLEITQPMLVGAQSGQVSFPRYSPGPGAEYGSDITSENTASAIFSQGDLATQNRAALPFGVNDFVNSDMTINFNGWEVVGATNGVGFGVGGGRNSQPGYFGKRNVAHIAFFSSGVIPSSVYMFGPSMKGFWDGTPWMVKRYGLPTKGGDRVALAGKFSLHGATQIIVRCRFWSEAGSLLYEQDSAFTIGDARLGAPSAANGDPNNFTEVASYFNAPAGASHATWGCYFYSRGADTNVYCFVTEPLLARVPITQTAAVAYSPGPADRAADVTGENVASAIIGQGPGATAANLAAFDPAAAAQLTAAAAGGAITVGSTETIKRKIAAGGTLNLSAQVSVNAGGSTSGNIKARIESSPFGVNSWSTVATGSGVSVTPSEPGSDATSGTFTNSTGLEQLFEFRVTVLRSPAGAGGTTISSQTFLTG